MLLLLRPLLLLLRRLLVKAAALTLLTLSSFKLLLLLSAKEDERGGGALLPFSPPSMAIWDRLFFLAASRTVLNTKSECNVPPPPAEDAIDGEEDEATEAEAGPETEAQGRTSPGRKREARVGRGFRGREEEVASASVDVPMAAPLLCCL